jgi:hypothetical protein
VSAARSEGKKRQKEKGPLSQEKGPFSLKKPRVKGRNLETEHMEPNPSRLLSPLKKEKEEEDKRRPYSQETFFFFLPVNPPRAADTLILPECYTLLSKMCSTVFHRAYPSWKQNRPNLLR